MCREGSEGRAAAKIALALGLAAAVTGCALLRAREDQRQLATFGRLTGEVRTEHESDNPMIVVLFTAASLEASGPEELEVVDHFVRERPGFYAFAVEPGRYAIAAFEDLSRDGNYDPDEPLFRGTTIGEIPIDAGEVTKLDLVIPTEGRSATELDAPVDIASLQARSHHEQIARSIGSLLVRGQVADLSDAKFGAENGQAGLWQPLDFVVRVGAGIYFTEPYDESRIPVLFVHGVSGYPQEFRDLIEGLDHERFQAWFYFYPSGIRLDNLGRNGALLMLQLQLRHGFDEFVVVAHSMGGLVSRALIFHHFSETERRDIPLLVTISTPWSGETRAIAGVERSPVVVESWRDVAANSQFLKDLFWDPEKPDEPRTLPAHVDWHMMFSIRGESRGDVSTDGSVTVTSQLRREAQDEVLSQLGLDATHTGILRTEDAKTRLNSLLAATFD